MYNFLFNILCIICNRMYLFKHAHTIIWNYLSVKLFYILSRVSIIFYAPYNKKKFQIFFYLIYLSIHLLTISSQFSVISQHTYETFVLFETSWECLNVSILRRGRGGVGRGGQHEQGHRNRSGWEVGSFESVNVFAFLCV